MTSSSPITPSRIAGHNGAVTSVGRSLPCAISRPFQRADDGSRTRDLRLGKPTLYQLSYVRVEGDSTAPPESLDGSSGRAAPATGPDMRVPLDTSRRRVAEQLAPEPSRSVRLGAGPSAGRSLRLDRHERQQSDDLHQPPGMRRHLGAQPELASLALGRPDQACHRA
jgi:hypothetical protein